MASYTVGSGSGSGANYQAPSKVTFSAPTTTTSKSSIAQPSFSDDRGLYVSIDDISKPPEQATVYRRTTEGTLAPSGESLTPIASKTGGGQILGTTYSPRYSMAQSSQQLYTPTGTSQQPLTPSNVSKVGVGIYQDTAGQKYQIKDIGAARQTYRVTRGIGLARFIETGGVEGTPFKLNRGQIGYNRKTYTAFEVGGKTYTYESYLPPTEKLIGQLKGEVKGASASYLSKLGIIEGGVLTSSEAKKRGYTSGSRYEATSLIPIAEDQKSLEIISLMKDKDFEKAGYGGFTSITGEKGFIKYEFKQEVSPENLVWTGKQTKKLMEKFDFNLKESITGSKAYGFFTRKDIGGKETFMSEPFKYVRPKESYIIDFSTIEQKPPSVYKDKPYKVVSRFDFKGVIAPSLVLASKGSEYVIESASQPFSIGAKGLGFGETGQRFAGSFGSGLVSAIPYVGLVIKGSYGFKLGEGLATRPKETLKGLATPETIIDVALFGKGESIGRKIGKTPSLITGRFVPKEIGAPEIKSILIKESSKIQTEAKTLERIEFATAPEIKITENVVLDRVWRSPKEVERTTIIKPSGETIQSFKLGKTEYGLTKLPQLKTTEIYKKTPLGEFLFQKKLPYEKASLSIVNIKETVPIESQYFSPLGKEYPLLRQFGGVVLQEKLFEVKGKIGTRPVVGAGKQRVVSSETSIVYPSVLSGKATYIEQVGVQDYFIKMGDTKIDLQGISTADVKTSIIAEVPKGIRMRETFAEFGEPDYFNTETFTTMPRKEAGSTLKELGISYTEGATQKSFGTLFVKKGKISRDIDIVSETAIKIGKGRDVEDLFTGRVKEAENMFKAPKSEEIKKISKPFSWMRDTKPKKIDDVWKEREIELKSKGVVGNALNLARAEFYLEQEFQPTVKIQRPSAGITTSIIAEVPSFFKSRTDTKSLTIPTEKAFESVGWETRYDVESIGKSKMENLPKNLQKTPLSLSNMIRGREKVFDKSKMRESLKNEVKDVLKSRARENLNLRIPTKTNIRAREKVMTKQQIRTRQILKTRTISRFDFTKLREDIIKIPSPKITKDFVRPIKKKAKKRKSKLVKEYRPDVSSVLFNIRGKRPTETSYRTGLLARPLTR